MVKICLTGKCKDIRLKPNNGQPARCFVQVELDHDIPLTHGVYDVHLLVPTEFAALLEVGLAVTLTLEQSGD